MPRHLYLLSGVLQRLHGYGLELESVRAMMLLTTASFTCKTASAQVFSAQGQPPLFQLVLRVVGVEGALGCEYRWTY